MSAERDQFAEQFGAVLDLAKWNEKVAGFGHSAWFRSGRPVNNLVSGNYETEIAHLTRVQRLDGGGVFAPGIGVAEPAWMANDQKNEVQLTYERTLMDGDGYHERPPLVQERSSMERDTFGLWRMPGAVSGYTPARVGRACVRWSILVDTFQDLGTVVSTYLDWMHAGRQEEAHESNARLGRRSMQRSLLLAVETDQSYVAAAPYVDVLANNLDGDNPNHLAVLERIELALRNVVLGHPIEKKEPPRMVRGVPQPPTAKSSSQSSQVIPVPLAMEAVKALDARDVLTPRWWMGTAIVSGGAITVPDLLPMVHEKLVGDEGAAIAAETPAISSQALIRSYIGSLLTACANDETRYRPNAVKFQRLIVSPSGAADLIRLVHTANWILENEVAAAESRPPKRIPPERLKETSMFSIGDALLTILYHTRPEDASNEVWGAQFDQDVLHAEILDTLHARLSYGRTEALKGRMALDSLRLRYPFVDRQTLETIRGELTSGASPAVLRGQYRGSQGVTVSRWRLKTPGRGFLS